MTLIVGFRVDPVEFELGRVLAPHEYERIEVETIVPAGGRSIPLFWISDRDRERFVETVREDDNVERFEELESMGGKTLYAIEWLEEPDHLMAMIDEADGHLLSAFGDEDGWDIEVRFERDAAFPAFERACEQAGIGLDLERKYHPSRPDSGPWFGLTDPQWEALSLALENGYFEIPRRYTVADLADELGISDQAMSERIRRAMGALVQNTMAMSDRES